ncbi:MAG TPA: protein translocase subunit SecF, partial [Flavobacteriales bacterium]|nr:protein translocase subunit SecF [Flavobacteriales bacterium]
MKTKTWDFMSQKHLAIIFSAVLLLVSVVSLIAKGLVLGIDFTGGTLIEVGYEKPVELTQVRHSLAEHGFPDATVQLFGTSRDILIRMAPRPGSNQAEVSTRVLVVLQQAANKPQLRRVEFVGPRVGDELTEDGGLAMLYALFGILIYVTMRFEYRFAVGSVAALLHDVLITLGFFSLFQIEFDLTVLAAILAVIGYSLNDTIVVFDRIRENFRKMRKGAPAEVINRSLNQTLSRTVVTSVTTLLVLMALFIFGGQIIHHFALALIVGVVIGTYSSIYVASTTALMLGISKVDLMPVEKEGAD